jgi:Membrane domain of glycerophosphoryl diester phosphodiesterase
MAVSPLPDLRLRPVLCETWALYRRLFGRTAVVATAVFLALELVEASVASGAGSGTRLALLVLSLALSTVGAQLVQGALAQTVGDVHERREPAGGRELYARTRPRVRSLAGAALITSAVGLAGMLLLVIPGLIVFTRWSLAVPVIVLERRPALEALRRSNELVRGRTWRVLRLTLTIFLAAGAAGAVVNVAFSGLPAFWATWIGGTAAGALVMPFVAHALTVVYFRVTDPGRPVIPEPVPSDHPVELERRLAPGTTGPSQLG